MLEKAGQNNCHYTTVVSRARKKTTKNGALPSIPEKKKYDTAFALMHAFSGRWLFSLSSSFSDVMKFHGNYLLTSFLPCTDFLPLLFHPIW